MNQVNPILSRMEFRKYLLTIPLYHQPHNFNEKWLANPANSNVGADHRVIFRAALRETSLGNVSGESLPSGRGMEYRGGFCILRDIKTS